MNIEFYSQIRQAVATVVSPSTPLQLTAQFDFRRSTNLATIPIQLASTATGLLLRHPILRFRCALA